MLHVEDWAEIRRLHLAERMPIKQIARHMGISKNTVRNSTAGHGTFSGSSRERPTARTVPSCTVKPRR
jgi:transposase-like protein